MKLPSVTDVFLRMLTCKIIICSNKNNHFTLIKTKSRGFIRLSIVGFNSYILFMLPEKRLLDVYDISTWNVLCFMSSCKSTRGNGYFANTVPFVFSNKTPRMPPIATLINVGIRSALNFNCLFSVSILTNLSILSILNTNKSSRFRIVVSTRLYFAPTFNLTRFASLFRNVCTKN